MTDIDLDLIAATARAASPRPWQQWDGCVWTDDTHCIEHDPGSGDLAYVALMDPDTTLALVARVREAEARALPDGDACICTEHSEDRGSGYYEWMLEYEPMCPQHSEHLYDPRSREFVSREAEERLAAVDALHFAEYDDAWEVNVCSDDRSDWPCPTHLAVHPECAMGCAHGR